ncbi:MAG: hypothetical protein K8R41_05050 [Bacteroidales bacterium]|nr:hypothetical protein [Bacteroidales bacterium]
MKIIITLSLLFATSSIFAQVSGLSASKLGTLTTATVPEGTIEFEPFFSYALSNYSFDNNGNRQPLFSTSDSTMKFSFLGFRFSYGLMKNLEIGITLPIDVSEVNFGAKYKLPLEGKFSMGLLAGYNTIMGNRIYVCRNAVHKVTPAYVGGVIMTYDFSDKFSIDFDAQYHKHKKTTLSGHTNGFHINSDIGYYLMEKVNFIVGLNYNYQVYNVNIDDSYLLTLNTGLAIERAEHFILVINAPFDILGKNEYKTNGFGLALTIMLD